MSQVVQGDFFFFLYLVEACWNIGEGWIYCCFLVLAQISTVRFLTKILSAFNLKQQMTGECFKSLANFKLREKNQSHPAWEYEKCVAESPSLLPADVVSRSVFAEVLLASPTHSSSSSARGCVEVRRRLKATRWLMGSFLFPLWLSVN